jgi:hypothetical protein
MRHHKRPAASRQQTRAINGNLVCLARPLALLLPPVCLLLACAIATAGTYTIYNCPSAPIPNGNAGPWQEYGAPTANKSTCTNGSGDFIGPLGAKMAPNSTAGVSVTAPAGTATTISKVSVYWYQPQSTEGAHTYAQAWAGGTLVGEAFGGVDDTYTPDDYTLPAGTTSFTLQTYCSSDDGPEGCVIGKASETPDLEMFGSQITLEDPTPPAANVTGGILAGNSTLTGTQSLNYTANDASAGVRLVKLLIDGTPLAENNYSAQCSYQTFLACPASVTDTINWNTATVADGEHSLQAVVEDAAQNTTVFYHATVTTHNAPANTSQPILTAPSQLTPRSTVSVQPGAWSSPAGAGSITYTYQWQNCESQNTNCQPIPGAQSESYTPTSNDIGRVLRALVTAQDNDGDTTQPSITTATVQPPPTPPSSSSQPETQTSPPTLISPAPTETPNGTPASQTAILHIDSPRAFDRPYTERAFTLAGQLTNNHEQPIANATLDILEKIAGTSTQTLIGHAATASNGAFTIAIPGGPSRRITITYRAYTNEPHYTATATTTENVGAGAHITITPTHTSPTGTITIKGTINGPIPHQGVLVQILVRYQGEWVTIRNPRTNHNGTFHTNYQFHHAIGTFPFRIEIPTGQTNYPYTRGYSNTINTHTK